MSAIPYEKSTPPRPVLGIAVSDPLRRATAELMTRVDTGFDGGLLIPLERYLELGLQEFEDPSNSFVARSAQGVTVRLRSSRGIVTAQGRDFECSVYATPILLRPLLGVELLNHWRVVLHGPSEELSIAGPHLGEAT